MAEKGQRQAIPQSTEAASIQFSESLTITKRLSKSGGSICLQIPKEVVEILGLDSHSLVEIKIRRVAGVRIKPAEFVGA